jgi:hypothetical protein
MPDLRSSWERSALVLNWEGRFVWSSEPVWTVREGQKCLLTPGVEPVSSISQAEVKLLPIALAFLVLHGTGSLSNTCQGPAWLSFMLRFIAALQLAQSPRPSYGMHLAWCFPRVLLKVNAVGYWRRRSDSRVVHSKDHSASCHRNAEQWLQRLLNDGYQFYFIQCFCISDLEHRQ